MAGIDVVFVGVHCAVGELERRERIRGDRVVGTAAKQINLVHLDTVYERNPATGTRAFDRLRLTFFADRARP
jgi:chloramphenicol 3-O phosphotransferase